MNVLFHTPKLCHRKIANFIHEFSMLKLKKSLFLRYLELSQQIPVPCHFLQFFMFHGISVPRNHLLYPTVIILIPWQKLIFPPIAIIHFRILIHLMGRAVLKKSNTTCTFISRQLKVVDCNLK